MKYVFILVLGLALGYAMGFKDGRVNKKSVVARVIGRVGGDARRNVQTDPDRTLDSITRSP